jgi:catechol 2,3-dioxygenase-like lactoylglutathione lyase family enzyme
MATSIRAEEKQSSLPMKGVEAPIKAEGFNHLHISVRDLARSIRFYKEAFGLKVGFSAGKDLIFMVPEGRGHSLALHEVGPDEPVGMAGGFQHFGFKLDFNDHDRVIKQVEKAGGKLISRGKHGGKFPYAYVTDPDGYVIEL